MVVNNVNITNVYRNARFGNGATAVTASDFQRGNYRNRVAVDAGHLQQAFQRRINAQGLGHDLIVVSRKREIKGEDRVQGLAVQ